jgi:hypothetical protein
MNIPEFTAQASLYRTSNSYRSLAFDRASPQRTVLLPQLGGPGFEGKGNCISDCADLHPDWTKAQCGAACRASDGPPCKPQDNSLNRAVCINGTNGWEAACAADCALLSGGGILGMVAAAACAAGCHAVAAQQRSDCPSAVICT